MSRLEFNCTTINTQIQEWLDLVDNPTIAAQWPSRYIGLNKEITAIREHIRQCDDCAFIPNVDARVQALLVGQNPLLADGLTLTEAARELAIGKTTLLNWRNRYDNFPDGLFTASGETRYLVSEIYGFMQQRGLTGKRTKKDSQGIEALYENLATGLSENMNLIILLAISKTVLVKKQYPGTKNTLQTISEACQHAGEYKFKIEDLLSKSQLQNWWKDEEWSHYFRDKSHNDVIRFVQQRLRLAVKSGASQGSLSLSKLIRSLIPEDKKVVDLSPSSAFLVNGSTTWTTSVTSFVAMWEYRVIAHLMNEVVQFNTYDGDWLEPVDASLWCFADDPVIIGVSPNKLSEQQSRNVPTSVDSRVLPGCERATSSIDLFLQTVVAYMSPGGVAYVFVPSRWGEASKHKEVREALIRGNYIDWILELPESLLTGNTTTSLLCLSKNRRSGQSIKFISSSPVNGDITGPRLRDLNDADIEYILRQISKSGSEWVGQFDEYDSEPEPVLVPPSKILESGCLLFRDAYLSKNGIDLDSSVTSELSNIKYVKEILQELEDKSQLWSVVSSQMHQSLNSLEPISSVPSMSFEGLDRFISVKFVQRQQGSKWQDSDFEEKDIVINLLGNHAGSSSFGQNIDATWLRVVRLRVEDESKFSRDFLFSWLQLKAKALLSESSTRSKPSISRESILATQVPVLSGNSQQMVVEIAGQLEHFRSVQKHLNTTLPNLVEKLGALMSLDVNTVLVEKLGGPHG